MSIPFIYVDELHNDDVILTLPTSTDTLVGQSTTDTLINKTIAASNNTITIDTDDVTEGSRLYYTTARFNSDFASKFQDTEDNAETTDTFTTWQQKLRLTTTNLPLGKYRLGYNVEIKSSGGESQFRIYHQTATTELGFGSIDMDIPNYTNQSGFKYLSSLSGVNNFDIDYKAISGSTYIKNARIELQRIS